MKKWNIISEEASIVLVGSFNPPIFHPEWLIAKQIVERWDYSDDNSIICTHDLAQISLPDSRTLGVYLNKLILKSPLASNHIAMSDFVASVFSLLAETPLNKLGMNYTSTIRLADDESWESFGRELAPKAAWEDACGYITDDISDEEQRKLGLWSLTMQLPRPDDLTGNIRPKIEVVNSAERTLILTTNNHVELEKLGTSEVMEILATHWPESLSIAKRITENLLESQIGN